MLLTVVRRMSKVRAAKNLLPFIAVVAAVFFVNEACSALVRHTVEVYGGFWVLKPVVFVNHIENSEGTTLLSGPLGPLIYGLVTMLIVGVSIRGLRHHQDVPLCWHRLGLGLLVGGVVANAYQSLIVGSVTDFIGVRPLGLLGSETLAQVFSLADIAICAGAGILGLLVSKNLGKLSAAIRRASPFSDGDWRRSARHGRDRRAS